jgi:hypothetical protein
VDLIATIDENTATTFNDSNHHALHLPISTNEIDGTRFEMPLAS